MFFTKTKFVFAIFIFCPISKRMRQKCQVFKSMNFGKIMKTRIFGCTLFIDVYSCDAELLNLDELLKNLH